MKKTDHFDELMDIKALCKFLGVGRSWVYQRTRDDRLPHVKVGPRLIRFKKSEVEKWIERSNKRSL